MHPLPPSQDDRGPRTAGELLRHQEVLKGTRPETWSSGGDMLAVASCFVAFARGLTGPGGAGDPAWAAAVLLAGGRHTATSVIRGRTDAPYQPGLLYLRTGRLSERALRGLSAAADLLLINGTGLDHPRRAGLALHLGAALNVPSVGVTHRPLCAAGTWPEIERGSMSPLVLDGELVGYWVRTRRGARPIAVHAAWRTDARTAAEVAMSCTGRQARTPEPLRIARRAARTARAFDEARTARHREGVDAGPGPHTGDVCCASR